MNAYRMLEILGEQNQFELLEGENGYHTPQDIRLVYLMNDAAECVPDAPPERNAPHSGPGGFPVLRCNPEDTLP